MRGRGLRQPDGKFSRCRARWRTPVVPATREAEPAGSLEPRSSGLQCAMPSGRPR
uniref:Uncharacterized protein n=1 Tax=Phasianus colchicus TaxID=9054 RepID=A0A669R025_PHACC